MQRKDPPAPPPSQSCFLIKSAELRVNSRMCHFVHLDDQVGSGCAGGGCPAGGAAIPICTALKNIECAQNLQVIMMCG